MVVARGERREVAEPVERDGVLRRAVADCRSVLGDLAVRHVVRRLSTDEETIAADDRVRGEGRALLRSAQDGNARIHESGRNRGGTVQVR